MLFSSPWKHPVLEGLILRTSMQTVRIGNSHHWSSSVGFPCLTTHCTRVPLRSVVCDVIEFCILDTLSLSKTRAGAMCFPQQQFSAFTTHTRKRCRIKSSMISQHVTPAPNFFYTETTIVHRLGRSVRLYIKNVCSQCDAEAGAPTKWPCVIA